MDNLLANLNPEQEKAVTAGEGPILIVAGAGTGKTMVVTARLAYLIGQKLAKPEEILALTFTDKAAGEMVERVDRLLPYGYLDLWISTFHSFAERILKEQGLSIGLPVNFKLLNEFEQWVMVKKNLAKFELDYYRPLGNPSKFIQALLKHFSRAKDEDISPEQYLAYAEELKENLDGMLGGKSKLSLRGPRICGGTRIPRGRSGQARNLTDKTTAVRLLRSDLKSELAMTDGGHEMVEQEVARINEVANAYHTYQQLLLDSNALDFGDLINYCLKLFRQRPAILEQYRRQFKYFLVDEFQDTNWAQYELVKILAAPKNNLVVVCDDDQAIFRFRGASMSNILQFKKDYPEAQEIFLVKNYRNRQNLLDLSYKFIQLNNPNRLEYQLNKNQKSNKKLAAEKKSRPVSQLTKKLVAQNSGQAEIKVIGAANLAEEVAQVVDQICQLKLADKEASWNDFAILVRANDSAKEFCGELESRGLPFIFLASRGLYTKPVVMDIIAYFKLLDNYHESSALYRILNLAIFEFSSQELINFNHLANKKAWSLYEVLSQAASLNFSGDLQAKINRLLTLVSKQTRLAQEKKASEVLLAFVNESGYLKYLLGQGEAKSREAFSFLNQLMKRIKTFEAASDESSVKVFLAELSLEMEAGEAGSLEADLEAGPEAIRVLTVHSAKGLEFKDVFLVNLVDKRFPTTQRAEAIALPEALVKEILPQGDIHCQEERRLFYVAMTRAKAGLYLSWTRDLGGKTIRKPSRFLIELGLVSDDRSQKQSLAWPKSAFSQPAVLTQELAAGQKIWPSALPNYFSYTQLAAYSSCPYQYRFAHVLKIPVRGKAQFSFGKTLHHSLFQLFTLVEEKSASQQADLFNSGQAASGQAKIELEEVLKIYRENWLDDWYLSKEEKEKYFKKGQEIIKEFYLKHRQSWPPVLALEKKFNFKIKDQDQAYTIRGTIDRIDQVDGQLKIIDYKTGKAPERLIFENKEQLLIYQLAAAEIFSQPLASLAYYFLDNNSQIEFLGSQAELEKLKTKIIAAIGQIRQGNFLPKPSQLCKWCDYREICEYREY